MSTSNGRMASQLVPLNTDITSQQLERLRDLAKHDGNKIAHQRVLTTSHRKPPLRRSRQGLHPRVAEVCADFAVLPG